MLYVLHNNNRSSKYVAHTYTHMSVKKIIDFLMIERVCVCWIAICICLHDRCVCVFVCSKAPESWGTRSKHVDVEITFLRCLSFSIAVWEHLHVLLSVGHHFFSCVPFCCRLKWLSHFCFCFFSFVFFFIDANEFLNVSIFLGHTIKTSLVEQMKRS